MRVRTVAVLVSVSLAVGAVGTAVLKIGNDSRASCENTQALVEGLNKILDRSTARLPQLVKTGVYTQAQADRAARDNRRSKDDIRRPPC